MIEMENNYEIDFGGNLKAQIKVTDNNIEIVKAMDGWGNSISVDEINVTNI